jgi:hypothetical protein
VEAAASRAEAAASRVEAAAKKMEENARQGRNDVVAAIGTSEGKIQGHINDSETRLKDILVGLTTTVLNVGLGGGSAVALAQPVRVQAWADGSQRMVTMASGSSGPGSVGSGVSTVGLGQSALSESGVSSLGQGRSEGNQASTSSNSGQGTRR